MKKLFTALIICFSSSAQGVICEGLFGDSELYRTIHALAELRLKLDLAQTSNEDSITISFLKTKYQEKEKALLIYVIQKKLMTPKELVQEIKSDIINIQKDQKLEETQTKIKRQNQNLNDLTRDGSRAIFHRIEPGKFLMGNAPNQREVKIDQPFEMMATTLTQIAWINLRTLAWKHGHETPGVVLFRENSGDLRPFHGWSWHQVKNFVDIINTMSNNHISELGKILVGHKDGDQYDLPTSAEWEYVARARGKFRGDYPYDDEGRLSQFASFGIAAHNGYFEVAMKSPLLIDGMDFYDMLGNIREWTKDLDENGSHAVVRGNQIFGQGWESRLGRWALIPIEDSSNVGIRLVRRLK